MNIKLFLLSLSLLAISLTYGQSRTQNKSTLDPVVRQSTMHDAIQYYHAKKGLTFYFRQVRTSVGDITLEDYDVIDLVNNRNLGSVKIFAKELGVAVDPITQTYNFGDLTAAFLKKYNGKFEYIMTRITPTSTDKTVEMCRQIMRRILRRNADTGDLSVYLSNSYFDLKNDTAFVISDRKLFEDESLKIGIPSGSSGNADDLGGGSSLAGNLAQGTAKFLIDRANQEINAAFFRRLKKVMDETAELQKLFPEVYKLTSAIETYNFDAALNALKTKLEEDLSNLLGNIPTLAELDRFKTKLNEVPELVYFFAICDVMNGLKLKKNAGSIIHTLYISPYVQHPTTMHANILKLSGLLSFSLRDAMICDANTAERGWIAPSDLNYATPVALEIFKYYIGFLAQSEPGVVFRFGDAPEIRLKDFLISKSGDVNNISGFVAGTYESLEIINAERKIIRTLNANQTGTDKIDESKFPHYKNIAIELVNITDRTVRFPGLFSAEQRTKILRSTDDFRNVYIPASEKILFIASNVEKKNYDEAMFNAGELINVLLVRIDTTKKATELTGKIFKYGQFFASVATAENGDDVKRAIDAIALPTGSSSLKKDLSFNVAINGYIGYFRRHVKADDVFVSGFTQSYGITAPVGVTVSTGFRRGGSLSLFAGVIDVGAIAQYELKTDPNTNTTTAEPEIDWGNIVSPSVSLVYGLPWYIPLSLGAGYQWIGNSASLSDDTYKLAPRFNVFLAFDIPVVNVYSKKRVKR